MTKGEIMKLIYTEQELKNIDTATPMTTWLTHEPAEHVMNYNDITLSGTLENLEEVAKHRKINLSNGHSGD